MHYDILEWGLEGLVAGLIPPLDFLQRYVFGPPLLSPTSIYFYQLNLRKKCLFYEGVL